MSQRTYEKNPKDCKCSQILKMVDSFLPPSAVIEEEWCSLLCELMKNFDSRFYPNNGQRNRECVCPVCGNPLCDWCEPDIPYGASVPAFNKETKNKEANNER